GRRRVREYWRALAYRRTALGPQPDAAARGASLKLRQDLVRARKTAGARAAIAAALLNGPFQRAFHRRRGGVDIVAIQAKPGLEPQAVARPQPDRQHLAAC